VYATVWNAVRGTTKKERSTSQRASENKEKRRRRGRVGSTSLRSFAEVDSKREVEVKKGERWERDMHSERR
jgi:hypothetical protein